MSEADAINSTVIGSGKMERPFAVVTGARHRVGAAVAIELARCGFDMLLTCRGDAAGLDETAAAAVAAGDGRPTIRRAVVDLDRPDSVAGLQATLATLPRLDAMVHNASSYAPTPLGEVTAGQAIDHFRVNALAPLLLTQAAWPALRRSILPGRAAVVCFGDIHCLGRPRIDHVAYAISKAALMHLVECLAREMAPHVRVNGIAPGVVAWPDGTPDDERRRYERRIPLGRPGTPDDAAVMARWLIVEAHYLTGEMIRLDGGRWLR